MSLRDLGSFLYSTLVRQYVSTTVLLVKVVELRVLLTLMRAEILCLIETRIKRHNRSAYLLHWEDREIFSIFSLFLLTYTHRETKHK